MTKVVLDRILMTFMILLSVSIVLCSFTPNTKFKERLSNILEVFAAISFIGYIVTTVIWIGFVIKEML